MFVVEGHPKLQDAIREKFSQAGFRVLIAQDPQRAILRYEEHPYHALVVDAGTAGEAGVQAFKKIIEESDDLDLSIAAILVLEPTQADWAGRIPEHPGVAVLVRPIGLKQLHEKLTELLQQGQGAEV